MLLNFFEALLTSVPPHAAQTPAGLPLPVTMKDMDACREPLPMDMHMADPCPVCGGFMMLVGDYASWGACYRCYEGAMQE